MNLTQIANALFTKKGWDSISTQDKEASYFIINRLLSKKFAFRANAINSKDMDKSLMLDIWYRTLPRTKSVPGWFWARPKKEKVIDERHSMDVEILKNFHPEVFQFSKTKETDKPKKLKKKTKKK